MIKKHVLPNGIKVIVEDLPYLRSISIGIWILTGSVNETPEISGISHFLEHLIFKGTEKRNAKQIAEELDNVGGHLDAFTGREYTCYAARVLDNHLPIALDLLHDIVINSVFPVDEIDREKGVIHEEICMYEDTPQDLVHDLFANTIWQGNSLGQSILGTDKIIKKITREDVISYYKKHYNSGNMIITATGNLKHDHIIKEIEKYFSSLNFLPKDQSTVAPKNQSNIVISKKKLEQIHFCLGTKGLPFTHPDRYSLYLLNLILGGSMSSRLFQNVREKHGLVYNIYSYQSSYRQAGLYNVYAGTKEANFNKVLDIVLNELRIMRDQSVTDKELYNVKEQLKGGITLGLESTESRMSHLAKSEIYFEHHVELDEIFGKIDSVTQKNIQELAQEIFTTQNMVFTAIGPLNENEKEKISKLIQNKLS